MNIILKSKVKGNYKDLMTRFDAVLFEYLKPSDSLMKVIEFTGSKKGDKVHLELFFPIKCEWISNIVADDINETEAYFIDEGVLLPPFLGYWKHIHKIKKVNENNSQIIDDISFEARWKWATPFLYPILFLAFAPRISAYKKYFGRPIK